MLSNSTYGDPHTICTTAVVVALRVVPGAASMWDLTVSHVHTFAVGTGHYVVHNCPPDGGEGGEPPSGKPRRDRLRGRDVKKAEIKRIERASKHLGMNREGRRGFGDYIEQEKDGA